MNLTTLPRYLIGNREAIEQIVTSRGALWLGGLFVLSAGFAREYDREDLLAEPYHVLLPFAASLVTSLGLALLLYAVAWMRSEQLPPFWSFYRAFLALYWMTAPLAWLYAIPYERFLSVSDAVRVNLWTLAIVSIWRVLLITRAASVLLGGGFWSVLMPIMLFADSLAFITVVLVPQPIIGVMGGVHLTDAEFTIRAASLVVAAAALLTFLFWLGGTVVVVMSRKRWQQGFAFTLQSRRVSYGLWGLAALALVVWVVALPITQPSQRLRHQAEVLLKSGRLAEGAAFMSRYEPQEFPRHWMPPPNFSYPDQTSSIADVLEAVADAPMAPWVRQVFLEKVTAQWDDRFGIRYWIGNTDDGTFDRYLAALMRMPEGPRIAREVCEDATRWWKGSEIDGVPIPISPEDLQKTATLGVFSDEDEARYAKLLELANRSP